MSQHPPFREREITPKDVLHAGARQLKVYEIRDAESARRAIVPDGAAFAEGMRLALEWLELSQAAPGLGWLIRHAGVGANYVVVARWGNLNELFVRTFAAPQERTASPRWRSGDEEFSFCVWDMRVLWHERNAYVRHMLDTATPSPEGYLADRCMLETPSTSRDL